MSGVGMPAQCARAESCGKPPREPEYPAWAAFSVSAAAGLFASFAPRRFRWSQWARPGATPLRPGAMAVSAAMV
ncbi:hypothetical protein [Streptomyces sp. NPDC001985]|uniref:hypothetical protein n=1 Tax=Streptomyces sp. NPDC001985 TaxID=3154406 RepID=UPI00331935FC